MGTGTWSSFFPFATPGKCVLLFESSLVRVAEIWITLMLKCYERKNIVDSAKQGLTDSALLFFHCKKRRQSLVHRLLRPRGVKQAIYVEWTHFMKTFVLHLHRQQGVSRGPTAHKRMNWNARGQRQPTAPYLQPIYKQEYACLLQIKEEKILWLGTVAKKRKKNGSIIGDEVHAEEIFAWASRGNLKWKTKGLFGLVLYSKKLAITSGLWAKSGGCLDP